jgi:peroxiredoxin
MVVLPQRAAAVRRYIEETGLAFNVLVDESRDVSKAYGVWQRAGLSGWNIARPALFVIGRDGVVRGIWVGEDQREFPSVEEILAVV